VRFGRLGAFGTTPPGRLGNWPRLGNDGRVGSWPKSPVLGNVGSWPTSPAPGSEPRFGTEGRSSFGTDGSDGLPALGTACRLDALGSGTDGSCTDPPPLASPTWPSTEPPVASSVMCRPASDAAPCCWAARACRLCRAWYAAVAAFLAAAPL